MERLKRPETLALMVSYIVLVAANALGEVFRFGGVTSADVSNEVFAWFAPAGYVFTIWSVIYVGLAVWMVRLVGDKTRRADLFGLPIGPDAMLFVVSCVLNVAWLTFWHLRVFPATVIVIVALLAVVGTLYIRTWQRSKSWLDRAPIALYASWLAVATVANVVHVATRAASGDGGLFAAVSTLVLLVLFAGATYVVHRIFDDYVFGIVVLWAGIGIGVRLVAVSPITGVLAIVISTIGVAAALLPWDRTFRLPQRHPARRR